MEVFSETPATTVNPLEALVGEGKKFKTIEDLAKSKVEADSFISTLTGENAAHKAELEQLRTELASRKTVEEQLKAITTNKVVPIPSPVTAAAGQGQVLTDEDLTQRVKAITERETQNTVIRNNVATVADKLVEVYGSEEKAKAAVAAKAKELNVSVKFLESAAGQSPAAFFSLVGVTSTSNTGPVAPRSEVNAGFGNRQTTISPPAGTYEAMRDQTGRLNVKALIDPNYLRRSMDEAMANPDKFLATA